MEGSSEAPGPRASCQVCTLHGWGPKAMLAWPRDGKKFEDIPVSTVPWEVEGAPTSLPRGWIYSQSESAWK
jgi:hypothetical protein